MLLLGSGLVGLREWQEEIQEIIKTKLIGYKGISYSHQNPAALRLKGFGA